MQHRSKILKRNGRFLYLTALALYALVNSLCAQPGANVSDLEKPKKFENRKLASEKSTEKKINPLRRVSQNLITHYNFQFNAYHELNDVVLGAKQAFRDDFNKLLPFYNYSLDYTVNQKSELDSVIHKCNNGILLHDLRNDWVDDLYLLLGQSYFFLREFDSAAITFQYINYAFQPRKQDEIGYDKAIGSNMNTEGNVYTISTKEKSSLLSKTVGHTPSRNDAILWLLRTLIEQGRFNESRGLIETLKRDTQLPGRLDPAFEEMQALWFYRQDIYDSAALHLSLALDNANSIQEKARWEYLIAQLFEKSGKPEQADEYYEKAIRHTTDPIMEAYARINQIKLITEEDSEDRIQKNLDELLKMAKRARYEEYRHIIYYAAAQIERQRNQPQAAIELLKRSNAGNFTDQVLKNNAFLQIADLAYANRNYGLAYANYDSLQLDDPSIENGAMLQDRKNILAQVVSYQEAIRVEDSLQRVAAMPEAERNAYIKSLVKKLRKEKGLKEEAANSGVMAGGMQMDPNDDRPVNIFASNDSKGEWYFYNNGLKNQGARQFKSQWGNRPNADNWRRSKAVNAQAPAATDQRRPALTENAEAVVNTKATPSDISIDGLTANLPLTTELLKQSNDTLESSFYALGRIFKDKLDDCDETIKNFENLLNRYPETKMQEEALFGLYFCYHKAGNTAKANFYKGFLEKNFNEGKYVRYIKNPELAREEENAFSSAATKTYENIYKQFIEGNFGEALSQKKKADSTYGENYWTAQLLYIESIYHIKQRNDSTAMVTLNNLIRLYPQSPMLAKAGTLVEVLSRRQEIEDYLTSLEVSRIPEDSITVLDDSPAPKPKETIVVERKQQVAPPTAIQPAEVKADSSRFKAPVIEKKAAGYSFNPTEAQKVVLMLNKVDIVYVNEARQALIRYNREKYYNQPLEIEIQPLNDDIKMVMISTFPDAAAAMAYLEKTRAVAQNEIFPWLPADKWSMILVSEANLGVLREQQNPDVYLKFLQQNLPGKF